jgi:hypothetical protein
MERGVVMAKMRNKPAFTGWPTELAVFDGTTLRAELSWHLDRCAYAARNGRTDIAMQELKLGTPSLRA